MKIEKYQNEKVKGRRSTKFQPRLNIQGNSYDFQAFPAFPAIPDFPAFPAILATLSSEILT